MEHFKDELLNSMHQRAQMIFAKIVEIKPFFRDYNIGNPIVISNVGEMKNFGDKGMVYQVHHSIEEFIYFLSRAIIAKVSTRSRNLSACLGILMTAAIHSWA